MNADWWLLPGPRRWTRSVLDDLRAGSSVVLEVPAHFPGGFREVLRSAVRDHDLWRWRPLDADAAAADSVSGLVEALYAALELRDEAAGARTPATLAHLLRGSVVWTEHAAAAGRWPVWRRFLAEYQHACQGREEWDRGLFCLLLEEEVRPAPAAEAALAVRRWEGVAGRLDMALYLSRLFAERFTRPLPLRLAVAVAAEVAGYDPELARALARADDADLSDPFRLVTDFAAARGWLGNGRTAPAWRDGSRDELDGESFEHSAACAARGDRAEVARRVWRGQVAVLYPHIEVLRRKLLPQVRGYLRLPAETTYGWVEDAEDLEVGQLVYFLRGRRLPDRLWSALNLLAELRNSLAHLKPARADALRALELLQPPT